MAPARPEPDAVQEQQEAACHQPRHVADHAVLTIRIPSERRNEEGRRHGRESAHYSAIYIYVYAWTYQGRG
jgi:hypothetical protein